VKTAKNIEPEDYVTRAVEIDGWIQDVADQASGEFTAAELKACLESGSYRGFFFIDDDVTLGIFICTKTDYAYGGCLSVVGAAGATNNGWAELTDIFNYIAKVAGCVRFEIRGRRGFLRALKPHGWDETYTVIGKDVF
tara:strand:- start:2946 stop:3359 length:414 start_codon:yes stop_codon:yes gene_type:complete